MSSSSSSSGRSGGIGLGMLLFIIFMILKLTGADRHRRAHLCFCRRHGARHEEQAPYPPLQVAALPDVAFLSRPDNPRTQGDRVEIEKAVPVLYLDLDGTVRQGKDDALGRFVNGPEDVVVFPEAVEMMRRWKKGGGRIIGVSNQGGIALGILRSSQVVAAMSETQKQTGDLFDKIAWCSHHPDAAHPEMARCWCRKPSPGLIVEASLAVAAHYNEIYPPYMGLMVGDRPEDEGCAKAAGLDFMWAAEWRAQANS